MLSPSEADALLVAAAVIEDDNPDWTDAPYDPYNDPELDPDYIDLAGSNDPNDLLGFGYALSAGLPITSWRPATKNPAAKALIARARRQFEQGSMAAMNAYAAGRITHAQLFARLKALRSQMAHNAFLAGRMSLGNTGPLPDEMETALDALGSADSDLLDNLDQESGGGGGGAITGLLGSAFNDLNQVQNLQMVGQVWDKLAGGLGAMGAGIASMGSAGEMGAFSDLPGDTVLVWWELGPADHCEDCIALSDASPMYLSVLDEQGIFPGSGHTVCGMNCHCELQYDVPETVCGDSLGDGGDQGLNPADLLESASGGVLVYVQEDQSCSMPLDVGSLGDMLGIDQSEQQDPAAFNWESDVAGLMQGGLAGAMDWSILDRAFSAGASEAEKAAVFGHADVQVAHELFSGVEKHVPFGTFDNARIATYTHEGSTYQAIFQRHFDAIRFEGGYVTSGPSALAPDFTMRALRDLSALAKADKVPLVINRELASPGLTKWLDTIGAQKVYRGPVGESVKLPWAVQASVKKVVEPLPLPLPEWGTSRAMVADLTARYHADFGALANLDFSMTEPAMRRFDALAGKFGLPQGFKGFALDPALAEPASTVGNLIKLNPDIWKDGAKYNAEASYWSTQRFTGTMADYKVAAEGDLGALPWAASSSPAGLMAHEFAHLVDDNLSGLAHVATSSTAAEGTVKRWEALKADIAAGKLAPVSLYATENPAEALAEAFTRAYMDPAAADEAAQRVSKVLDYTFTGKTAVEAPLPAVVGPPKDLPAVVALKPRDPQLYEVPGSPVPLNAPLAEWSGFVPPEPPLPALKIDPADLAALRDKAHAAEHSWADVQAGRYPLAFSTSASDGKAAVAAGLSEQKMIDSAGKSAYVIGKPADLANLEAWVATPGHLIETDAFWKELGYTPEDLAHLDAYDAAKAAGSRRLSAGVIIVEPDGRLWLLEPKGHYGGYEHTFSKGGVDAGESAAEAAVREVREEIGMSSEMDLFLGDYKSSSGSGITRFYVGHRTGGGPLYAALKETAAAHLVTPEEAKGLLTQYGKSNGRDQQVLKDLVAKLNPALPAADSVIPAEDIGTFVDRLTPHVIQPVTDLPVEPPEHFAPMPGPQKAPAISSSFSFDSGYVKSIAGTEVDYPPSTSFPIAKTTWNLPDGTKQDMYWKSGDQGGAVALPVPGIGAAPVVQAPIPIGDLPKVKALGGSTGAVLVQDPATGLRYVDKFGGSAGQAAEEVAVDRAYAAVGLPVPQAVLLSSGGKPMMRGAFIDGQSLDQWWGKASKVDQEAMRLQLQGGMAMDALMANWDVIGLAGDNILVDAQGLAHRIDNGGSLRYRAQGALKGSAFGDHVTELTTLRDPAKNSWATRMFTGTTDAELKRQVLYLDSKRTDILAAVPLDVRKTVGARLDDMLDQLKGVTPASTPQSVKALGGAEALAAAKVPAAPSPTHFLQWMNAKAQLPDPVARLNLHVAQLMKFGDAIAADSSIAELRVSEDLLKSNPVVREMLIGAGAKPTATALVISRDDLLKLDHTLKNDIPAAPPPPVVKAPKPVIAPTPFSPALGGFNPAQVGDSLGSYAQYEGMIKVHLPSGGWSMVMAKPDPSGWYVINLPDVASKEDAQAAILTAIGQIESPELGNGIWFTDPSGVLDKNTPYAKWFSNEITSGAFMPVESVGYLKDQLAASLAGAGVPAKNLNLVKPMAPLTVSHPAALAGSLSGAAGYSVGDYNAALKGFSLQKPGSTFIWKNAADSPFIVMVQGSNLSVAGLGDLTPAEQAAGLVLTLSKTVPNGSGLLISEHAIGQMDPGIVALVKQAGAVEQLDSAGGTELFLSWDKTVPFSVAIQDDTWGVAVKGLTTDVSGWAAKYGIDSPAIKDLWAAHDEIIATKASFTGWETTYKGVNDPIWKAVRIQTNRMELANGTSALRVWDWLGNADPEVKMQAGLAHLFRLKEMADEEAIGVIRFSALNHMPAAFSDLLLDAGGVKSGSVIVLDSTKLDALTQKLIDAQLAPDAPVVSAALPRPSKYFGYAPGDATSMLGSLDDYVSPYGSGGFQFTNLPGLKYEWDGSITGEMLVTEENNLVFEDQLAATRMAALGQLDALWPTLTTHPEGYRFVLPKEWSDDKLLSDWLVAGGAAHITGYTNWTITADHLHDLAASVLKEHPLAGSVPAAVAATSGKFAKASDLLGSNYDPAILVDHYHPLAEADLQWLKDEAYLSVKFGESSTKFEYLGDNVVLNYPLAGVYGGKSTNPIEDGAAAFLSAIHVFTEGEVSGVEISKAAFQSVGSDALMNLMAQYATDTTVDGGLLFADTSQALALSNALKNDAAVIPTGIPYLLPVSAHTAGTSFMASLLPGVSLHSFDMDLGKFDVNGGVIKTAIAGLGVEVDTIVGNKGLGWVGSDLHNLMYSPNLDAEWHIRTLQLLANQAEAAGNGLAVSSSVLNTAPNLLRDTLDQFGATHLPSGAYTLTVEQTQKLSEAFKTDVAVSAAPAGAARAPQMLLLDTAVPPGTVDMAEVEKVKYEIGLPTTASGWVDAPVYNWSVYLGTDNLPDGSVMKGVRVDYLSASSSAFVAEPVNALLAGLDAIAESMLSDSQFGLHLSADVMSTVKMSGLAPYLAAVGGKADGAGGLLFDHKALGTLHGDLQKALGSFVPPVPVVKYPFDYADLKAAIAGFDESWVTTQEGLTADGKDWIKITDIVPPSSAGVMNESVLLAALNAVPGFGEVRIAMPLLSGMPEVKALLTDSGAQKMATYWRLDPAAQVKVHDALQADLAVTAAKGPVAVSAPVDMLGGIPIDGQAVADLQSTVLGGILQDKSFQMGDVSWVMGTHSLAPGGISFVVQSIGVYPSPFAVEDALTAGLDKIAAEPSIEKVVIGGDHAAQKMAPIMPWLDEVGYFKASDGSLVFDRAQLDTIHAQVNGLKASAAPVAAVAAPSATAAVAAGASAGETLSVHYGYSLAAVQTPSLSGVVAKTFGPGKIEMKAADNLGAALSAIVQMADHNVTTLQIFPKVLAQEKDLVGILDQVGAKVNKGWTTLYEPQLKELAGYLKADAAPWIVAAPVAAPVVPKVMTELYGLDKAHLADLISTEQTVGKVGPASIPAWYHAFPDQKAKAFWSLSADGTELRWTKAAGMDATGLSAQLVNLSDGVTTYTKMETLLISKEVAADPQFAALLHDAGGVVGKKGDVTLARDDLTRLADALKADSHPDWVPEEAPAWKAPAVKLPEPGAAVIAGAAPLPLPAGSELGLTAAQLASKDAIPSLVYGYDAAKVASADVMKAVESAGPGVHAGDRVTTLKVGNGEARLTWSVSQKSATTGIWEVALTGDAKDAQAAAFALVRDIGSKASGRYFMAEPAVDALPGVKKMLLDAGALNKQWAKSGIALSMEKPEADKFLQTLSQDKFVGFKPGLKTASDFLDFNAAAAKTAFSTAPIITQSKIEFGSYSAVALQGAKGGGVVITSLLGKSGDYGISMAGTLVHLAESDAPLVTLTDSVLAQVPRIKDFLLAAGASVDASGSVILDSGTLGAVHRLLSVDAIPVILGGDKLPPSALFDLGTKPADVIDLLGHSTLDTSGSTGIVRFLSPVGTPYSASFGTSGGGLFWKGVAGGSSVAETRATVAAGLRSMLDVLSSDGSLASLDVSPDVLNAMPRLRQLLAGYGATDVPAHDGTTVLSLDRTSAARLRAALDKELLAGNNGLLTQWPSVDELTLGRSAAGKSLLTDTAGNQWMFHAATPAEAKAELAVAQLAEALGLKVPPVRLYTVNLGTAANPKWVQGSLTRSIPGGKSITSLSSLNAAQMNDMLRQSVLDWVTGNQDAHVGNWLIDQNGALWATDKGKAFSTLGSASDFLGNRNMGLGGGQPLLYQFWSQAQKDPRLLNNLSPNGVGSLFKKLNDMTEAQFRQIIGPVVESVPSKFATPQAFEDALLARKASAQADLERYWADQVKSAISANPSAVPQNWKDWLKSGAHFKPDLTTREATLEYKAMLDAKYGAFSQARLAALRQQVGLKNGRNVITQYTGSGLGHYKNDPKYAAALKNVHTAGYSADYFPFIIPPDEYQTLTELAAWSVLGVVEDGTSGGVSAAYDKLLRDSYNKATGRFRFARGTSGAGNPRATMAEYQKRGTLAVKSYSMGNSAAFGGSVYLYVEVGPEQIFWSQATDRLSSHSSENEILIRDIRPDQYVSIRTRPFGSGSEMNAYNGPVVDLGSGYP